LALSPLYDPIALKFVPSFSSPTVLDLLASFKVVRFHHHGSIHLAPVGFPFFISDSGGGGLPSRYVSVSIASRGDIATHCISLKFFVGKRETSPAAPRFDLIRKNKKTDTMELK
jgi:hypothetical protein